MLERMVDPRAVAFARIGLGCAGLLNTLELFVILDGLAAGKLARPLVDWAPPVSSSASTAFLAIAVTACVAMITGVATTAGAVSYSIAAGTVLLWDQQTYSSHQVLTVLLVAYLACAHSDAAWSLSSLRHGRRQVRWWPQLLMMTQLTAVYLFAGLSKINAVFLSGDPLSTWVRFSLPGWVHPAMAWVTVVTEVAVLAVGLWVPRIRVLAVLAGLGLHLSIVLMLTHHTFQLVAFTLSCVSLYPLFLTRPRWEATG